MVLGLSERMENGGFGFRHPTVRPHEHAIIIAIFMNVIVVSIDLHMDPLDLPLPPILLSTIPRRNLHHHPIHKMSIGKKMDNHTDVHKLSMITKLLYTIEEERLVLCYVLLHCRIVRSVL